jgi:hypothetical protein
MARTNWRDLPPVEPIDQPPRLSQTVLKHANLCARSAYLYLRHGSVPSIELDRGTAFHLFAERAQLLLVEQDEPILEADVAKDLMDLVLDEHPELGVTAEDALHLREMAYHMAGDERGRAGAVKSDGKPYPVGFDWRPQEIVAVERMFALDVEGWTVVGKIDRLTFGADLVLGVDDHKSQLHVPRAEDYNGTFQTKLYVGSVMFGFPLGADEAREPSVGDRIQWARAREIYPRYLRGDGTVQQRDVVYSRAEIAEFLVDLARTVRKVDKALTDWKWPAIRSAAGCGICPCKAECPLPQHLRSHAGEVNSLDEASEAAEWADATSDLVRATREEIKRYARHHQVTVPVGGDEEYVFEVRESFKTDWEALEVGVERAARFGEPWSLDEVRKRQSSTSFVKRKREVTADA